MQNKKLPQIFMNPLVGASFLVLMGGFVATIVLWNNPYRWPFIELGRQTVFLFDCRTLSCAPLAFGAGIIYTYLCAVGVGNAVKELKHHLGSA
ncbi:hypothetical protein [Haladaptatus sp. NG-SE-30]